MTRFMISLDQGVNLVWKAFEDMVGGEIYVKKIPSIKVVDIAKAISKNAKIEIIGIRPGEKIHESMISADDSYLTYEYKDYYKILPSIRQSIFKKMVKNGKKVNDSFSYTSDKNNEWMSTVDLKSWIKKFTKASVQKN